MPIYTRTGDTGTTSLYGGKRISKSEDLVGAYGSIDELNSWIGLIVSELRQDHLVQLFSEIQSDLFSIGGKLAGGNTDLSVLETRVTQMEVEIDAMTKVLPELSHFILPGGCTQASHIHITRSICRRAERCVVTVAKNHTLNESILKYLNRLSDLLFVLARFINNKSGIQETVWSQGENRS